MKNKELEILLEIFNVKYKAAIEDLKRDEEWIDYDGAFSSTLIKWLGDFESVTKKLFSDENV